MTESKKAVDIYILNTELLEGEDDRLLPVIAPLYARKYERMKVAQGKKHELGAGYLLYRILDVSSDEQLGLGEHGKPYLKGSSDEVSGTGQQGTVRAGSLISGRVDGGNRKYCEFSLSHSGKYVVLAVSDSPVGVDIECSDKMKPGVLERVLPPQEYELLKKGVCDDPVFGHDEKLLWTKSWTEAEAVLKAGGTGFMLDPRENPSFKEGWNVVSRLIDDNYVLSCALRGAFDMTVTQVSVN